MLGVDTSYSMSIFVTDSRDYRVSYHCRPQRAVYSAAGQSDKSWTQQCHFLIIRVVCQWVCRAFCYARNNPTDEWIGGVGFSYYQALQSLLSEGIQSTRLACEITGEEPVSKAIALRLASEGAKITVIAAREQATGGRF